METSVYLRLRSKRQMATWTAVKCTAHALTQTETRARHTHVHAVTHTAHTWSPKADKAISRINIRVLQCIGPKP